jgi:hypothetical protein
MRPKAADDNTPERGGREPLYKDLHKAHEVHGMHAVHAKHVAPHCIIPHAALRCANDRA